MKQITNPSQVQTPVEVDNKEILDSTESELAKRAPSFEVIPDDAPIEGAKKVGSFAILPWCC